MICTCTHILTMPHASPHSNFKLNFHDPGGAHSWKHVFCKSRAARIPQSSFVRNSTSALTSNSDFQTDKPLAAKEKGGATDRAKVSNDRRRTGGMHLVLIGRHCRCDVQSYEPGPAQNGSTYDVRAPLSPPPPPFSYQYIVDASTRRRRRLLVARR